MRIFQESGHVREEPLELHALGDLPVSSALAVERHLKDCQRCKRESIRIAEFIHILRLLAMQTQACDATTPCETSGSRSRLPDRLM